MVIQVTKHVAMYEKFSILFQLDNSLSSLIYLKIDATVEVYSCVIQYTVNCDKMW